MSKIMDIVAKETNGKSYGTYKYSYDVLGVPAIDYSDDSNRTINWNEPGETDKYNNVIELKGLADRIKQHQPLFKYFLDGSRHAYKVDDIAYNNKIYPIIAGQIGVGCCRRENKRMFKEEFERKLVIALPTIAATSSWDKESYFLGLLGKINSSTILSSMSGMHIRFDEICQYSTQINQGDKLESRGVAKVQDSMIELEKEMVDRLVKKGCLNGDSYLVKDGSLEYKEMKVGKEDFRTLRKIKNNYKWVIGVSKSFNPESVLAPRNKSNASRIADLPAFCRTPVAIYSNDFIGEGIKFGVWYLRIRDIKHISEPFSGIVKVEKLLMDKEFDTGLDTDTVNLISANLINERTPTCYGTDTRWANHIYPIYLTETFIKSQYIGIETFLHLF